MDRCRLLATGADAAGRWEVKGNTEPRAWDSEGEQFGRGANAATYW